EPGGRRHRLAREQAPPGRMLAPHQNPDREPQRSLLRLSDVNPGQAGIDQPQWATSGPDPPRIVGHREVDAYRGARSGQPRERFGVPVDRPSGGADSSADDSNQDPDQDQGAGARPRHGPQTVSVPAREGEPSG